MEFLKILFANSEVKEAKLINAANKAKANPEIGITINNKAAYHVIRDCADITIKYLPLYVFGNYKEPFQELKGKFSKKHLGEFILEAEKDLPLKQLLILILEKIKTEIPEISSTEEKQKIDFSDHLSDPYGDYGQEVQQQVTTEPEEQTHLKLLSLAFDAKD